jgi:hypothetical protein
VDDQAEYLPSARHVVPEIMWSSPSTSPPRILLRVVRDWLDVSDHLAGEGCTLSQAGALIKSRDSELDYCRAI